MRKMISLCSCMLFIVSCGKKSEFVDDLQGEWKVTQLQYIYSDTTYSSTPADMRFVFNNFSYQSTENGTVYETGNFNVNPKVTQIEFQSGSTGKIYLIEENTPTNQTWKSKNPVLDFYLRFMLQKQ